MKIPKQVIKAGKFSADHIKYIEYLGKYKGADVYHFAVPDAITGFPFIFLYKEGKVQEIKGFDALHITDLFVKD